MRWGKLVLVLTITGGIVVFNVAFKNVLVKKGIEAGLQSIFQAKAEVRGVNFSIINARLYFSGLEVANADSPFRNLFELGKSELRLNAKELLKGKVIIENLECQGIAWNTERKTSGALPHRRREEKSADTPAETQDEGADFKLFDIENIDAKAILEQYYTNLQSIAKISNINAQIEETSGRWKGNVETAKQNVDNLSQRVNQVNRINVRNIKTIAEAESSLRTVNEVIPAVDSVRNDVQKMSSDITKDKNAIESEVNSIRRIIDNDFNYLKSLIQLPEGGAKGLIGAMINRVLAEKLGAFYGYGLKALEFYKRFDESRPPEDKNRKDMKKDAQVRRFGYDMPFPAKVYPSFLLQNLATSISNKADSYFLDAYLRDVASDPNLWDKPTTFNLGQVDKGQEIRLQASIDPRTNYADAFELSVAVNDFPYSMEEGLEFVNIKSIRGDYRFRTEIDIKKNGDTRGKATINLVNTKLDMLKRGDFITDTLYDVITSVPVITVNITYRVIQPEGRLTMNIDSNLDREIARRIGKLIDDMVKEAERVLRSELTKLIEPELKKNENLYAAFKEIERISQGNLTEINKYKREVDAKKAEIEKKINDIKKEAEDKARQEAQKQIDGARDRISLPSGIPGR
jgi:uncharacterized protein (TIGR03545 family)